MNTDFFSSADFYVAWSVSVAFGCLLYVMNKEGEADPESTLYAAFPLLIGLFSVGRDDPHWGIYMKSAIFGGIAGTLIQPITDAILTRRTLVFGPAYYVPGMRSPLWFPILWGVALWHLSYFWLRLPKVDALQTAAMYCVFVVLSAVYFGVFEWVVSNFTVWWKRQHCRHDWGVATYALVAEGISIMLLPMMLEYSSVWAGFIGGIVILIIFVSACDVFYEPPID